MVAPTLESALQKHRQGQLAEAGALYQQILVQDPKNIDALRLSSVLSEQNGELPKAIEFARQMVAIKPRQIEFQLHLANLLLTSQNPEAALVVLETALKLDRRNVDVHLLLGDACQQQRAYTTALHHYQKALQLDRSIPEAYNNMGNAYLALGETEIAIQHYQKAIAFKPTYTEAHFNLGNALRQFGNLPEAIAAFQQAITLEPRFYRAHSMLGLVAKTMNQYEHAEAFYRQSLAIHPHDPGALTQLAIVLSEQSRMPEALEILDTLLQDYAHQRDDLAQLALTLSGKGYFVEAQRIYDALALKHPHHANTQLNQVLALPMIYQSTEELHAWRQRYEAGLEVLLQRPIDPIDAHHVGTFSGAHFYLAYQGLADKALQIQTAAVYQKLLPSLTEAGKPFSPSAQNTTTPPQKTKIRLGFISGHLSPKHTIGKLMQGILEQLSREQFEIYIYSTPTKHAFTPSQQMHPDDHVYLLPYPSLQQSVAQIKAAQLDILFYPDIGMDPFSYLLAQTRLAPVQCVTWGHPVTTGIPTIDYFISSKALEPDDAQTQYSEKLILLDSLPTYYFKPQLQGPSSPRAEFGWDDTDHIYLCPQSLYKFHPDFDPILAEILRQDPLGKLILLDPGQAAVCEQLKQRFSQSMPDVLDRVQFVPGCSREKFLQLLTCATVMLDPLHFGGGNTTYEALAFGIPIVTLPSAFMRGRVTAACYQRMGLSQFVTQSPAEYVARACEWAKHPEIRRQAQASILEKNGILYEDPYVVEELTAFFIEALAHHQGDPSHG